MKKLLLLMLLCLVQTAVMAQNAAIHIKGVVQDASGEPVTGASPAWALPPTWTDSSKSRQANTMCCKSPTSASRPATCPW